MYELDKTRNDKKSLNIIEFRKISENKAALKYKILKKNPIKREIVKIQVNNNVNKTSSSFLCKFISLRKHKGKRITKSIF